MSTERYRGLDKKWTVLAYIYLFIMHLKAKLRKRQRSVSSKDSTAAQFCSKSLLENTNINNSSPKMLKQNNWMNGNDDKMTQKTSNTRTDIGSVNGGSTQEATTAKEGAIFGRLFVGLKKLKNVFSFNSDNAVDVENRSTTGQTASVSNIVDATPIEQLHHTSLTRQLAFGPWQYETDDNVVTGFFKKITLAQITTFALILICIIIVVIVYTKEAEMNAKWQKTFGTREITSTTTAETVSHVNDSHAINSTRL